MDELVFAPPHKDLLLEYAEKVNSQPLPSIKSGSNLRLAPDKFTTTAPNFAIVSNNNSSNPNVIIFAFARFKLILFSLADDESSSAIKYGNKISCP